MIWPNNQKNFVLLRLMPFVMSRRKLVRNSKLLLAKTTLGTITGDTTKVDRMEDFVVNVDQASTSDLMLLSILRLLETTKILQLIIQLMYPLLTEALIEGDTATALDLNTMPAITLTGIATQNSILIVIQIDALNFRNLFRIEFVTRTTIGGFAQVPREKVRKRLCSIVMLLRLDRSF